jgi:transcriptional regulator with XRE-family HTH domain
MATKLGGVLATARKKRGWSLRAVERRTGIHNAHLAQIENGTIERPDPNMLWTLATVYELEFPELMRLAGHVGPRRRDAKRRSLIGAALYALEDLSPEEQEQVFDFMAEIKRRRSPD